MPIRSWWRLSSVHQPETEGEVYSFRNHSSDDIDLML